jgi:hypothetical protein
MRSFARCSQKFWMMHHVQALRQVDWHMKVGYKILSLSHVPAMSLAFLVWVCIRYSMTEVMTVHPLVTSQFSALCRLSLMLIFSKESNSRFEHVKIITTVH